MDTYGIYTKSTRKRRVAPVGEVVFYVTADVW